MIIIEATSTPALANDLVWKDYQTVKTESNKWEHFELARPRPKRNRTISLPYVYRGDGISFGERFLGQSITSVRLSNPNGVFDIVTGQPSSPLQIVSGKTGQNIAISREECRGSAAISGMSAGTEEDDNNGEGALSVQFVSGQQAFGFAVKPRSNCEQSEIRPGLLVIKAYADDGKVVGSLRVPVTQNPQYLAIGTKDNSPSIFGVSLTNSDPGGVGFDDFVYTVRSEQLSFLSK